MVLYGPKCNTQYNIRDVGKCFIVTGENWGRDKRLNSKTALSLQSGIEAGRVNNGKQGPERHARVRNNLAEGKGGAWEALSPLIVNRCGCLRLIGVKIV